MTFGRHRCHTSDSLEEGFRSTGSASGHGANAYLRLNDPAGDAVFGTYFIDNRDEAMGSTWSSLDITAFGRQEEWENSPGGYPQTPPYQWWRRYTEYSAAQGSQQISTSKRSRPTAASIILRATEERRC